MTDTIFDIVGGYIIMETTVKVTDPWADFDIRTARGKYFNGNGGYSNGWELNGWPEVVLPVFSANGKTGVFDSVQGSPPHQGLPSTITWDSDTDISGWGDDQSVRDWFANSMFGQNVIYDGAQAWPVPEYKVTAYLSNQVDLGITGDVIYLNGDRYPSDGLLSKIGFSASTHATGNVDAIGSDGFRFMRINESPVPALGWDIYDVDDAISDGTTVLDQQDGIYKTYCEITRNYSNSYTWTYGDRIDLSVGQAPIYNLDNLHMGFDFGYSQVLAGSSASLVSQLKWWHEVTLDLEYTYRYVIPPVLAQETPGLGRAHFL